MPRIISPRRRKTKRPVVAPCRRLSDELVPHSLAVPMHHIFLNADMLIQISSWLEKTSDHIAFAGTSQWCYAVLKRTIYTHVVLHPDGPAFSVIAKLLGDPVSCAHVARLDIFLSTRPSYSTYVPGRDDIQQMWQKKEAYVRDIRIILKRANQLKRLNIDEGPGEHLREQLSLETECEKFPFSLSSLRLNRPSPGALHFLETHPRLNHLILTQRSNSPHDPENWHFGFSSTGDALLKLQTLWASPWWMRAFLMRSPVRTFGLVHRLCHIDYLIPMSPGSELGMLVNLMTALGDIGGHPTVRYLALPWNDFTLPNTSLTLRITSKAFPRTQKLAVTLDPGQMFAPEVLLITLRSHLRNLGSNNIFQSVREFCFLLPGEWPHDEPSHPPEIKRSGKDCDHTIPHALLKLMPGLVHIDTLDRCYSRVGAGVKHPGYGCGLGPLGGYDPVQVFGEGIRRNEWHGEFCFNVQVPPSSDIVWFGRPRSKCSVAQGWV